MKKRLVLIVALAIVLLMAGSALAAPLTDYSKAGNAALSLRGKDNRISLGGDSFSKTGYDMNLTFTVARNFALEFDYGGPVKKTVSGTDIKYLNYDLKYKYMAAKNDIVTLIPYLGLTYDRFSVDGLYKDSKNKAIIGATGVFSLIGPYKLYLDVGVGSKFASWEVGASYAIIGGVEFDLGYSWRRCEFGGSIGGSSKPKIDRKGLFLGITCKFG